MASRSLPARRRAQAIGGRLPPRLVALVPMLLLVGAAHGTEGSAPAGLIAAAPAAPRPGPATEPFEAVARRVREDRAAARRVREDRAAQVRIEQRTIIRIIPHPSAARPDMVFTLPGRTFPQRIVERRMGPCLPGAMIGGVRPEGSSRLLLFLRDGTVVRASLERSCRARDFYSGFYYSRSPDGKLCIDRDSLLSRSGVDCKITRMRQLVVAGY